MTVDAIPTELIIDQIDSPHDVWVMFDKGQPVTVIDDIYGNGRILVAADQEAETEDGITTQKTPFESALALARSLGVNCLGVLMLDTKQADFFQA